MTWTPPPRTAETEAIHSAAEEDRRTNPSAYSLDPDDILERAIGFGGSPDSFVGDWREGLERFCASAAEDGRLNALGARAIGDQIAAKLAAGSKVATRSDTGDTRSGASPGGTVSTAPDAIAADPDDGRGKRRGLLPPIVITGGWRSGTTFLFRLLATDPRLRAPLPIDLTRPWRVAGLDPQEREELLARLDGFPNPLHVLNPTLRAVHDHGNRLPEECVLGLGVDLRSWGVSSTVRLESYSRWLAGQDLGPSYDAYRQLLELIDDGDGRRFVLKAPAHTAELRTVVETFPGAVVVHLHRDIVETIASGASLFAVFRSTYSDSVDPIDVGRFQTEQTELWLRRAAEYADGPHSADATILDVAYGDLVASPADVVTRILDAAGMDPPDDPRGFVEAYDTASPRHAHGTHRYSPEEFGLVPAELRERFAFTDRWAT